MTATPTLQMPRFREFLDQGRARYKAYVEAKPFVRVPKGKAILERLVEKYSVIVETSEFMGEMSQYAMWVVLESGDSELVPGDVVQAKATPGETWKDFDVCGGWKPEGWISFVGTRGGSPPEGSMPGIEDRWRPSELVENVVGVLREDGSLRPLKGVVIAELQKVESISGIELREFSQRFKPEATVIEHSPRDCFQLEPGQTIKVDPRSWIRRVLRDQEVYAFRDAGVLYAR